MFLRFRAAGLTLNASKCAFAVSHVEHLGHIVSAEGIRPNPAKVSSLVDFAAPHDIKSLQRFLGLCGWFRRFIPRYAEITAPLNVLMQKDTSFVWTPVCQLAFTQLKRLMSSAPILVYPDPNRPFLLVTDASGLQVGGALLQEQPDGTLHPILYLSHTLDHYQRKYSTIELECFALFWCVTQLRHYLHGVHFLVRTDHRCLQWLHQTKDLSGRVMRWSLKLQDYQFTVVYGKGATNVIADALPRLPMATEQGELPTNPDLPADASPFLVPSSVSTSPAPDEPTCCLLPATPRDLQLTGSVVRVPGSWFPKPIQRRFKLKVSSSYPLTLGDFHPNGARPGQDDPRFDQWDATLQANDNPRAVTASFPILRSAVDAYVVTSSLPPAYLPPPMLTDAPVRTAPSSSAPYPSTEVPIIAPPAPDPALVHLPSIDEYRVAQRQDASLLFWYTWTATQQPPELTTPESSWWKRDRDLVTLDDRGLLVRFPPTRHSTQLVIPTALRDSVLHAFHGLPLSSHFGFNRTYARMLDYCFWPSMADDVRTYLAACPQCQGVKYKKQQDLSDVANLAADFPNDLVAIDCAGPLRPSSAGNK